MPKVARNGQAEILSPERLSELWTVLPSRYVALFGCCYYTLARVGEARQLRAEDLLNGKVVYRCQNTKSKTTRTAKISTKLQELLDRAELPASGFLFPGSRSPDTCVTRQACDHALRQTCDYLGWRGVSTHSFRRSGATHLHLKGVPLETIRRCGGWSSLEVLQIYLGIADGAADEALLLL
jgi:integrase/recombinase XerD